MNVLNLGIFSANNSDISFVRIVRMFVYVVRIVRMFVYGFTLITMY